MTAPARPLSLRLLYGESLRLVWRDLPLILAIMLPFSGAGLVGASWLREALHAELAQHPTAEVFPWLADTLLSAIADAGVVWVALRRLGGGRGPAIGGVLGVMTTLAVMAIDLLEGADGLAELMVPAALIKPIEPAYDLIAISASALWAALWMPAVAIAVAERRGGPTSLGRALGLSLGHLRTLFIFALTLGVASLLLVFLASLALASLGFGAAPFWVLELMALPIEAVAGVGQAVVYWQLTRLKTGAPPSPGAAEVFG